MKKLLIVTLVLCLCFPLLVACGGTDPVDVREKYTYKRSTFQSKDEMIAYLTGIWKDRNPDLPSAWEFSDDGTCVYVEYNFDGSIMDQTDFSDDLTFFPEKGIVNLGKTSLYVEGLELVWQGDNDSENEASVFDLIVTDEWLQKNH